MNGRTRVSLLAGLLILAASAPSPAAAQVFRMQYSGSTGWTTNSTQVLCTNTNGFLRWPSQTTTWYLNTAGQGAGKQDAIKNALAAWTNVPNADFVLNYGGTTGGTFMAATDTINSLSWGTHPVCDTASCHALTALRLAAGQQILESDILFNASATLGFQWKTDGTFSPNCEQTAGSFGLMLDTQGIATHELGHGIGIGHPSNAPTSAATMGIVACTTAGRSLENDDILSLRCSEDRYPANPIYQGSLDAPTCQSITGWAWNANSGHQRSYVEIVEILPGGTQSLLGLVRADLPGAPVGDGNHAFSFSTPASQKNGSWHTVRARYTGNQTLFGPSQPLICAKRLFPNSLTPSDPPLSTGGLSYEVGTQFASTVPGKITQLGYYFAPGEAAAGSHTLKLWSDTGTLLGTAIITGTPVGWVYGNLSTPVSIAANTNFRVSVDTYLFQSKSSCGSPGSLQGGYVNSPLTAIQGFWRTGVGAMPTTASCSNFFVSVQFDM